ncbi:hypothetical protein BJ170DRAFT_595253 [Xylariales sp. AK1849]|nr:hypothetical protein BJ170DRAFT_595253 [Xylariales sp. AK1849]
MGAVHSRSPYSASAATRKRPRESPTLCTSQLHSTLLARCLAREIHPHYILRFGLVGQIFQQRSESDAYPLGDVAALLKWGPKETDKVHLRKYWRSEVDLSCLLYALELLSRAASDDSGNAHAASPPLRPIFVDRLISDHIMDRTAAAV